MPKFNPDFWEIPVPPEYFNQFTTEDYFWYRAPDDEYAEARRAKRQVVSAAGSSDYRERAH